MSAPSVPVTPSPEIAAAQRAQRSSMSVRRSTREGSAFEGIISAAFDAGAALLRATRPRAPAPHGAGESQAKTAAPHARDVRTRTARVDTPRGAGESPAQPAGEPHDAPKTDPSPRTAPPQPPSDPAQAIPVVAESEVPTPAAAPPAAQSISPAQAAILLDRVVPQPINVDATTTPAAANQPMAPPAPPLAQAVHRGGDQLTLHIEGEDGASGHLRVAVRGQTLRATLVTQDAHAAQRLESRMGDLTRALAAHGFTDAHVAVRAPSTPGDAPARGENRTPANTQEHADPHNREGGGRRDASRREMLRALRDAA
jgi:hypothetical protein